MRKIGGRGVETEEGNGMTETAAELEKEKAGKDIGVEVGSGIGEEIVIEITSTSETESMGGTRTTGTGTDIENEWGFVYELVTGGDIILWERGNGRNIWFKKKTIW